MPAMTDDARSVPDDSVLPFQIESSGAMGRLVRMGPAITTILGKHDYPAPVSTLLGEALTLTAMLGAALKTDGKFILQTRSDGVVSFLVAQYNAPGSLRGYASFDADALARLGEEVDGGLLLGKGHLAMTIDPGPDMERYQGVVPLEGGNLTAAADTYFRQSVQLPTFIKIAVARHFEGARGDAPSGWSWRAGGLMVQRLSQEGGIQAEPPADEGNGHASDEDWTRAQLLAATVEDHELVDPTLAPERLLYRLFHEERVRTFRKIPVAAFCPCSRQRVEEMLSGFTPAEIAEMAQEDGGIRVTCEFCNSHYDFKARDFIQDAPSP